MLVKKNYGLKDIIFWTRAELYWFTAYAILITGLHELFNLTWLQLPWMPIALIGTAVAFLIGFQNNAAYDRIWEARKIWGGIVNSSRSWGMMVRAVVNNSYATSPAPDAELKKHHSQLIHRHIAWLTAMRHSMRAKKPWEIFSECKTNREWQEMIHIPEYQSNLDSDLKSLLTAEDFAYTMSKTNKATALLTIQSNHLKKLHEEGLLWEFSFLELEKMLVEFFNLQGKSERIKNFPYPRQYSSFGRIFVWIFIFLLPFGIVPEFAKMGSSLIDVSPLIAKSFAWLSIPFTVVGAWVFHSMQRIGTAGENPFEGSPNDVPISTIARGIEIDLREMLNESKDQIPEPFLVNHDVQM